MLVPLPIGFLVGAFLTDIAYLTSTWSGFAYFSAWLIAAGIVTVLLLFNGWMGGELVFRGRVGVLEAEPERET